MDNLLNELELVKNEYKACFDYLKSQNTCLELIESLTEHASLTSVQNLCNHMHMNNITFEV
jgi:hypothetical protein